MRLDHLLSKEHTPRTIYRAPAFVGVAVWWALVVFTSGIIDERLLVMARVPEYGICSPLWGGAGVWKSVSGWLLVLVWHTVGP